MNTILGHVNKYGFWRRVVLFVQLVWDLGNNILSELRLTETSTTFSEAGFRYVYGSSGATRLLCNYMIKNGEGTWYRCVICTTS